MTIQLTSTTDSPENVTAAMGGAAPGEKAGEAKSAPEKSEQEQSAATGTAETEAEPIEGEEAEPAETEPKEGNEAEDIEKDKPKKKGGFQKRIDKLNTRVTAAQQEAEYWKQQALKGAGQTQEPAKVDNKPAVADGEPNPDKFDTHAEYVKAVARWEAKQALQERDQREAKSAQEIEQANALKTFNERMGAFKEKTVDFDEVVSDVDDIQAPLTVRQVIFESENGPALMYELAKNREEFARICKLSSPLAVARELGKIEARLSASEDKKPEPKKTTNAPKPLAPVGAKGGSASKDIYDPNMSQKEYEAIRAKQRAARNLA